MGTALLALCFCALSLVLALFVGISPISDKAKIRFMYVGAALSLMAVPMMSHYIAGLNNIVDELRYQAVLVFIVVVCCYCFVIANMVKYNVMKKKVAVLEDTVEELELERAAAMSQAVNEEQQHKVQEALDWFAAKISVFSKEEQEAINACTIAFAERDQMVIPKVNIAVNAKCSQANLMAYASSAFFKIGKKRKSIAQFLSIVKGDEELEDGPQIDIHALYEWADKNKTTPKTSAPSIETAMNVMRPYIDEGREIICFSISSEMSTSINVIRMAAEELDAEDKVTVIDSRNLSTGIGLLVVEAAVMAADGKSREEIKTGIDELIPKVRASFVVDTLVYLYRGGRCNAVSALIGGALALHPMIVVKDGKMDASRKYRGKIGKVIKNYAKDLEEDLKNAIPDRVFITHSECDAKTVEEVRDYIAALGIFKEIIETRAGGVISSHCGPGTLGVLFIAK